MGWAQTLEGSSASRYEPSRLGAISAAELVEKLLLRKEGEIVFHLVDLRIEADFGAGHIPGAVNLPFKKLPFLAETTFAKTDDLVLYGHSSADKAGVNAAILLMHKGFGKITFFEGGYEEWKRQTQVLTAAQKEALQ